MLLFYSKVNDTVTELRILGILMHLRPFQNVFMCIVCCPHCSWDIYQMDIESSFTKFFITKFYIHLVNEYKYC